MSLAPPTLAVAGATQILVAAAFFLVGNRLRKRNVAGASRGAVLAFVGWWWGLAIYLGMVGALAVAAVAGWMPFSVHLASRLFAGPLLCAAVAGLAYHILFILTGRSAWRWVLAVYYGAAAIAYDALTLASHPTSVVAAAPLLVRVARKSATVVPVFTTLIAGATTAAPTRIEARTSMASCRDAAFRLAA